ncbi:MAG: nicotinamide riboside transporter PnuC [Clostridium sp.]|nr:nicotinamide riboside transporter PnuC [Clostridium sp.]
MSKKNNIVSILIVIFSIICGIISKDYFLGTIILICGLLNSYYASIGKIYNYIFGALYCLLSGYVCYLNGLYGIAILSLVIYFPSQIQGYLSWKKNTNNNEVQVRGFNTKNSIIITTFCIVGSIILGFLLSKIPGQQLAFLDASSNIINLCGIILMNLRFKECWAVWLFNNSIDLSIWVINFVKGSPNSTMMLLVSIGYLLINVYGLIKWIKMAKNKEAKNV